jgi:hypothetical protein
MSKISVKPVTLLLILEMNFMQNRMIFVDFVLFLDRPWTKNQKFWSKFG